MVARAFDPTHDIPDLTGRVALVSGANTGMGYQIAEQLALKGAKVYLGARTAAKGLDAISRIEAANPTLKKGSLEWLPLEMGTVAGTYQAAQHFLKIESRLDLLINNAAILDACYSLGAEGIESAMATNHLGPFVLTTSLLPLLKKTASEEGSDVRIITVGSDAQNFAPGNLSFVSLEDLNATCAPSLEMADTFMNRSRRYGFTKLANTLFANELAHRLSNDVSSTNQSIISLSLHPGLVSTDKGRSILPWWAKPLAFLGKSPLQGASTALFAATSPTVRADVAQYQGSYLVPYGVHGKPCASAKSAELAKQLWELSERVTAPLLSDVAI